MKKALRKRSNYYERHVERIKRRCEEIRIFTCISTCDRSNGSVSLTSDTCTASIAPCTERVEIRDYADSRTIYPMPFLTNENQHLYTEAYDVNPYELIDLYAAAQKHVDQGISMTLYVTDQWTTEQLSESLYLCMDERH